jgi:pimeloyl-ACP methyl ester carboxylesterase
LIYGAGDRLVPPAQGRRLAERIPSSELLEIPGATHWSTAFAEPTVARAAAWIDGVSIPRPTPMTVSAQA